MEEGEEGEETGETKGTLKRFRGGKEGKRVRTGKREEGGKIKRDLLSARC